MMAPSVTAAAAMSPVTAICADTAHSPTVTPGAAIPRSPPSSAASKGDSRWSRMLAMQPLSLGIVEDRRDDLGLQAAAHGVDGDRLAGGLALAAALDQAKRDGTAQRRAHIAGSDIAEAARPGARSGFLDRMGAGGNHLGGIGGQ